MIRLAATDDVASITSLIDAAYGDYIPALGRRPQPMSDDYGVLVDRGEVSILAVDGALAGVLVLQHLDDALLVRTVGIAPSHQRRGWGSVLMAHAERQALVSGKTALRLYTNEVMAGNVELYGRLGYTETHRTGPEGRQVVYMMKVLHA